MPSDVDLCNDALGQIGALFISALDDGTINANHCTRFYPTLRDAALVMTEWTFNRHRVALALDVDAPLFEFAYSYTLPADFLKLIQYAGEQPTTATSPPSSDGLDVFISRYKIESGHLLTNDAQVSILYAARLTNPDLWSPMFYQGLATQLAGKLASAITKDSKKSLTLWQEGTSMLTLAAAIDGQQGSIEPIAVNDLLWGR